MKEFFLGVDPGIERCGLGLISLASGKLKLERAACVRTASSQSMAKRLLELRQGLFEFIPKDVALSAGVEKLFFVQNVTNGIDVAQARGVVLLTLEELHIPAFEYAPTEIKKALTGHGRAEKVAVQAMVCRLLGLQQQSIQDDAADGLAVAISHYQSRLATKRPIIQ